MRWSLHRIKWIEERGISMVTTILVTSLLSTISVVTISMVISNNRISANHVSSTQAMWLAESGLEMALYWLRNQDPPPGGVAPFTLYNEESLAGGTYTVVIDPADQNAGNYIKRYSIRSTGAFGNASRVLEIQVKMSSFGKYAYVSNDEGPDIIWFNSGDIVEGPLHSNDQIAIYNSPLFKGRVTSSASSFYQGGSFNPTFQEGYQLNAPQVDFPTWHDIIDNYWQINTNPPELVIDARFGKDASIEFNSDGTITYNVWHWELQGGHWEQVYDIENATANLEDLNGLIMVQGDVQVSGTVNGVVTILATDDIYIVDDIVYADAAPGTGWPNPGCDDMLGLISAKNVVVADTPPNRENVVIDAAILALDKSFYVENYSSGSPRGRLHLWGSLGQMVRGPVGTFGWRGQTGYEKDYHYDERLKDLLPPYYPTTGGYEISSWREIIN